MVVCGILPDDLPFFIFIAPIGININVICLKFIPIFLKKEKSFKTKTA